MFDVRFFWLVPPLIILLPLWVALVRHYRATNRATIAAIVSATVVALWGFSLYVRTVLAPNLLEEAPWKGINLDAALLGFIGPVAVVMGIIAAARGARWWQVLLVELSAVPLTLLGCAAGISV